MHIDIASLLYALMINQITMAVALPAVMGQVSRPARLAQWVVVLQAAGWALLLGSGLAVAGSGLDRLLSVGAIACLAISLTMLARAFDLWRGRRPDGRAQVWIAIVLPLGYGLGFSNYPFRVGWANGLLALQMVTVALSLARPSPLSVGRWRWLVVMGLLAQALVTAWRGVLGAFFTASYPTFLAPHPVNYAWAVVANGTSLLSLIGMLLAHRDEAARGLERLAMLDGLTGALNRRAWISRAGDELAISTRYGQPLAVLMIDLDHFKQINDSRGHEAGDRALRLIVAALHATVRTGDLVGRFGGEEFCVLMNQADAGAAIAFDLRLRTRLFESTPRELGFVLDYSAGIAMRIGPEDTLQAMLKRADATMYRAKAEGRARTLVDVSMQPPAV